MSDWSPGGEELGRRISERRAEQRMSLQKFMEEMANYRTDATNKAHIESQKIATEPHMIQARAMEPAWKAQKGLIEAQAGHYGAIAANEAALLPEYQTRARYADTLAQKNIEGVNYDNWLKYQLYLHGYPAMQEGYDVLNMRRKREREAAMPLINQDLVPSHTPSTTNAVRLQGNELTNRYPGMGGTEVPQIMLPKENEEFWGGFSDVAGPAASLGLSAAMLLAARKSTRGLIRNRFSRTAQMPPTSYQPSTEKYLTRPEILKRLGELGL